jgi:hypothetical protein
MADADLSIGNSTPATMFCLNLLNQGQNTHSPAPGITIPLPLMNR